MKRRSFLGVLAAALAARKLPAAPALSTTPSLETVEQEVGLGLSRISTRIALDLDTMDKVRPLSQQFANLQHAQFTGRQWIFGLKVQPPR